MNRLNRNTTLLGLVLSAVVFSNVAFATSPPCPVGTVNCSNQHMGDTETNADNNQSHTTQVGNSTASNQSGNSNTGENNLQQSGNTVDQSGNTVRSGDSNAAATGNLSTNDNRSSVGNTSSSSGGNQMNGLGGSAATGPVTSTNNNSTGPVTSTNTNTANGGLGGQGGQGGQGGTGGTGTALSGSLSGVVGSGNSNVGPTTNTLGQGQSNDNSGNSTNTLGQGQSNDNSGNSTNTLGQGQSSTNTLGQGQAQGQSNDNSGNSNIGDVGSTSNSGGNSLQNGSASTSGASNGDQSTSVASENNTTSGASADDSGNSEVNIDNSDRSEGDSYTSQALFIPTIQTAAPSIVAGSTAIVDRSATCGPRQGLVTEEVYGTYLGMVRTKKIFLGSSDRIVSVEGKKFLLDDGDDGVKRLIGHRPVSYIAVIGVAGSRSIGLGGGKTGGDWGQAGASGGSSMQRLVVQTNLEDCVFAATAPAPVIFEAGRKIGQ